MIQQIQQQNKSNSNHNVHIELGIKSLLNIKTYRQQLKWTRPAIENQEQQLTPASPPSPPPKHRPINVIELIFAVRDQSLDKGGGRRGRQLSSHQQQQQITRQLNNTKPAPEWSSNSNSNHRHPALANSMPAKEEAELSNGIIKTPGEQRQPLTLILGQQQL